MKETVNPPEARFRALPGRARLAASAPICSAAVARAASASSAACLRNYAAGRGRVSTAWEPGRARTKAAKHCVRRTTTLIQDEINVEWAEINLRRDQSKTRSNPGVFGTPGCARAGTRACSSFRSRSASRSDRSRSFSAASAARRAATAVSRSCTGAGDGEAVQRDRGRAACVRLLPTGSQTRP